ncbi:MAG: hypothetical protein ACRDQ6_19760 [Pseudonocardiaceae bacterium]
MIDLDATLSQQFFHVSVGESEPHRHHDHLRWEAKTGEARPRRGHSGKTTMHQPSLPARSDPPTQQCPATRPRDDLAMFWHGTRAPSSPTPLVDRAAT